MYRETMYFIFFEIILFSFSFQQMISAYLNKQEPIRIYNKRNKIEIVKKIESEVREIKIDEIKMIKIEAQPKKEIYEIKPEETKEVKVQEIKKNNKIKKINPVISYESDDADIIWFDEN